MPPATAQATGAPTTVTQIPHLVRTLIWINESVHKQEHGVSGDLALKLPTVSWVYDYGMNFSNFKYMGYEFLLMLVFVGFQAVVEVIFLFGARMGRHHDFEHRVSNLLAGLACSMVVIAFDLALQYAL